jgi:hypothetical protein
MYYNTNYQRSGAGALLQYMEKEHPLRNSVGREVTNREREHFVQKSERHQFEREIRISPDPEADLSQEKLERETQRYVREFTRDRQTVSAIYAYHEDNGIPHVHVALTGEERDLYIQRNQLEQERERLAQRMERGRGQTQTQELTQEQGQKQEQRQELRQERDLWPGEQLEQEREIEHEQRLRQERELEQGIEQTQEQELEQRQELEQEQSQSQSMDWW